MDNFKATFIAAIASFLAGIILPKKARAVVAGLLKFVIQSIARYWYLIIDLSTGIICLIATFKYYASLFPTISLAEILWALAIATLVTLIIAIVREFYSKTNLFSIAIYECFSVKDNDYLTLDVDAASLNEKIDHIKSGIESTFASYNRKFITINRVTTPEFIVTLLGYTGFKQLIKRRVNSKKHLAALHFVRNVNEQHVTAILQYNTEALFNTHPIVQAEHLLNELSEDRNVNGSLMIELSVNIYMLLFGQSVIELLMSNERYEDTHDVLSDSAKLIGEIQTLASRIPTERRASINNFLRFWQASAERYRAVVLMKQQQYPGALQHIIKSTQLFPYLPYESYAALKHDFNTRYTIDLIRSIRNDPENSKPDSGFDLEKLAKAEVELPKQIRFPHTPYSYEIVLSILHESNTDNIRNLLIEQLGTLDESDPFILLFKSEIIKRIKKGDKMINEIYADQVDETIQLLKRLLVLDPDFYLIHSKIGSLLSLKGFHDNNFPLVEEGMKEYSKGMHFLQEKVVI